MAPSTEQAFLAAIADAPGDNTHRLVFSDWLEDHDQPDLAEFIRLQCRLDPDHDRYDDPTINALRGRVEELLAPRRKAEEEWLRALVGQWEGVRPQWRRGFVDALEVPVPTFLRHGEQLRQRYPLLRKLVLFRLNGWGDDLAGCPWLQGLHEIDLPCWYADEDAQALAASPHLKAVERVVLWASRSEQSRIFAQGTAWPRLQNLHLIDMFDEHPGWIAAVNEAAGRTIGSLRIVDHEPYPIAANFDEECFIVGKLPDGTQLFLSSGIPCDSAMGVTFDPDGTLRPGRLEWTFPPEIVTVPQRKDEDWQVYRRRRLQVRNDYLRETWGFVPTMIHVRDFDFYYSPGRFDADTEDAWGRRDPARSNPADSGEPRGHGGRAYDWVTRGMFMLHGGNATWCDASGHIVST